MVDYSSQFSSVNFPQELRLIISREFDTGNWSLDELLKVFKTEVEARERCNSMAMTPSTTLERKHPHKPTPPTFNALLTSEGQRITCTFCKQDHKSVDWVVVTNVGERKHILKKQGRCFICFKRSHVAIVIPNGAAQIVLNDVIQVYAWLVKLQHQTTPSRV